MLRYLIFLCSLKMRQRQVSIHFPRKFYFYKRTSHFPHKLRHWRKHEFFKLDDRFLKSCFDTNNKSISISTMITIRIKIHGVVDDPVDTILNRAPSLEKILSLRLLLEITFFNINYCYCSYYQVFVYII